ncbi:hypothetical protein KFL_003410060 [Klebsormidium nitens]|uniref:Uncharacterized protein n=1 Tax=Klebsormidium nitens TaxID=105231 RepID=A0A1Y1ICS5_KLENI|nr:hypothetical protein KFL_003410060 [Klebsormidium nitens]|eukprot:GAQ87249.1 hypothetical protein KFL_003410060 [Klebsormidium nitens]
MDVDAESVKRESLKRELQTLQAQPVNSRYALHRRRVVLRSLELLEIAGQERTAAQAAELEQLLSNLSL